MTQSTDERHRPSWLIPALIWGTIVIVAIGIGLYAEAPGPPRGAGPVFRRVPAPPRNLSALLHELGVGSATWYVAVVALPLMLWGARRVDITHERRRQSVLVVLGVFVTLIIVTAAAEFLVAYGGAPRRPGFAQYLPTVLRENVIPWLALAGIVVAVEARRRSVHAALERERLRAEVAEQRLIALTGQLHPHFLFNTLQGISTLIHRDAEAADEMLAKLSDLLRDVLRHRHHVLVPIEDELRFVRTYLEIAQLRFADRLTFDVDVAAGVADASVPLFILQPLVENALSHGIGTRMAGGRIGVRAWRAADRLLLEVADDGAGMPNGAPPREGIGLSNTRERLRATFGDDQALVVEGRPGAGTTARIEIPYRRHAAPKVVGSGVAT